MRLFPLIRSEKTIRLGMIGCGDIAGYTAFLAWLNPGIRLAACCDPDAAAADRLARRFSIPSVYTDYRQLLEETELDAVYLAVPHDLHAEMIAAAIQAGRHVLCEKPVTRTLAEGRAIVEQAAAAGVRVGVNYRRRFDGTAVEDLAMGVVELEGGALVEICSSMDANPERPVTIEMYGERGTAIYRGGPLPHVRFHGVRPRRWRPPAGGLHALQRSLEGFRAWVVEGRPYLTPAQEALPVLAAIEAIYRAAQSGQRQAVEDCFSPIPETT